MDPVPAQAAPTERSHTAEASHTAEMPPVGSGRREQRRRQAAIWIAVVALLVAAGGGIATWALLRDDDPGPSAAVTTDARDTTEATDDATGDGVLTDTWEDTSTLDSTPSIETTTEPEPPPPPTTVTAPPVTVTETVTETVTPSPPPSSPPTSGVVSMSEARAMTERAFTMTREGRYVEAEDLSRRALTALAGSGDPRETNAYYNLGLSLLRQGRCAEALDPLERSLSRGTTQQLRIRRDTLNEARRCS